MINLEQYLCYEIIWQLFWERGSVNGVCDVLFLSGFSLGCFFRPTFKNASPVFFTHVEHLLRTAETIQLFFQEFSSTFRHMKSTFSFPLLKDRIRIEATFPFMVVVMELNLIHAIILATCFYMMGVSLLLYV